MSEKFNRVCRVEFEGINVDPIENLRIKFELDKSDGQTLNHGLLWIYNLKPETRAAIARPMPLDVDLRYELTGKVITVKVFAGYEGDVPQIYSGDILWAHNERVGPDWITHMEMYTGLSKATRPAQVSFKQPTSARTILEAILEPMQISLRYTDDAAAIIDAVTVSSYTGSGLAYRDADEFLKRQNLKLSFTIEEENQGLVYNPNRARDPIAPKQPGNTFSKDTGLIGTPTITRAGIQIRSLLRPHLALMQRFFVESSTTQGTLQGSDYAADYYATFFKHTGDNREGDWYTDIEGFYAKLDRGPTV